MIKFDPQVTPCHSLTFPTQNKEDDFQSSSFLKPHKVQYHGFLRLSIHVSFYGLFQISLLKLQRLEEPMRATKKHL